MVTSPRRARLHHRARRWSKTDGYNIVVLAVIFTIMNIMIAKVLPLWSTQIKREKEAELIFRGIQYAEAIRVYKLRNNGTYPTELKQLIETEPRSIRRLWNNPLDEEAVGQPPEGIGWDLIIQGRPGCGDLGPQGEDAPPSSSGETKVVGPIIGVCSKVGDTAIKVFCDSDSIQEWRFEERLVLPPQIGGGQQTQAAPINAKLIGKPWPQGITPRVNIGNQGCRPNQVGGGGQGPDRDEGRGDGR